MADKKTPAKLPGLRHIGSQGRNPLVILGYNASKNEVMALDMNLLRQDEIIWLSNFISDEKNYKRSALAPSLADTVYSPGISAFVNFAGRGQQLPLYEVRISDADQLHEWNGTDASHDPRIPPHPLVDRIRELRTNGVAVTPPSKAGSEIPREILEASAVRSGAGDVMDTVRQFIQTSDASLFVAKDPDAEAKSEADDSRLKALEDRLANIEKLLRPARKTTVSKRRK